MFIWNKFKGIKNKDLNLRISGSAALDLAYVASGKTRWFFSKKI